MPELTNIGSILISEALPEDLRQDQYVLDKKGVHSLFMQLAEKHPDKYKEVLDKLSDVGASAAWTEGASVSLSSLRRSKAKDAILASLKPQVDAILNDDSISDDERDKKIVATLSPHMESLQKAIYDESKAEESPFALQIDSGARGKKSDLNSMRGADLLVSDANDQSMPVPMWNGYAQGMTPAQYFAASYGQRKGAVGVKFATADAGYMTKRLSNASHRFVVSHDTPMPTRLLVGLPVPVKDKDSVGAVLAKDAGPYKAGTVLTGDMLDDLDEDGVEEILVHSVMSEPSMDGGVSRLAAGRRLQTGMSPIGENIGLQSAQAVGERLSQGSLNSKHSAGVSDRVSKSGIEYLNRLLDAPEHFPEAGPLAEEDGVVDSIITAPQGGSYIKIGKANHYVPQGITPVVKAGDHVEMGDELSDGTPHPEQLVRLRGMGEARRVYMTHLREALAGSGSSSNRRNVEPVVAGLLNWARVTSPDGIGDHMYDDVVPFNTLAAQYKPRKDAEDTDVNQAVGRYLEEPALHYTAGTRVTKKVAKKLKDWGINSAFTHTDPPSFEPDMQRSTHSVYNDPDWRTRLLGFYTSASFTNALHRGAESDTNSTSYAPAMAKPNILGRHLSSLGKYGKSR